MSAPDIHAVLFDFDGTLAPNLDLPDMRRQVIELTRCTGVPEDIYRDHYIVEIVDAVHAWLMPQDEPAAHQYFQAAHQLIVDIEIQAAQITDPFPGIPDKLNTLRAAGKRLGVVTRNCREAVLQVFPALLDHVDALYARGDTACLKPDPRHLLACVETLDCKPVNTAMVGDGAMDMSVGRQLEMYCVGVLTGSSSRERLQTAGAHRVIAHCLDLEL